MNVSSSGTVLATCQDAVPSGNVLDFTYGFNHSTANNGNVISWSAVGNQSFSRSYAYDELNRLKTMSGTGGSCTGLSWTYDIWANRTAQTVTGGTCPTSSLSVNNMNRITNAGFSYDAAGNLIAEPGRTYQYDAENHMTSVNSGAIGSYVYDASGRRVKKVASGVTTEYLYSPGGNVLAELQNGTTWTVGYIYLNGQLLAQYKDGTTHFFHRDHLGSTRVLTKVDQSIHDSMEFLPYGEQVAGDTGSTRKFTGQERDAESTTDYFRARQYAYTLGRFLQPDEFTDGPVELFAEIAAANPTFYANPLNPQSLNKYAYVYNNPLRYVDPSGHVSVDPPMDWEGKLPGVHGGGGWSFGEPASPVSDGRAIFWVSVNGEIVFQAFVSRSWAIAQARAPVERQRRGKAESQKPNLVLIPAGSGKPGGSNALWNYTWLLRERIGEKVYYPGSTYEKAEIELFEKIKGAQKFESGGISRNLTFEDWLSTGFGLEAKTLVQYFTVDGVRTPIALGRDPVTGKLETTEYVQVEVSIKGLVYKPYKGP
jgi:RHS repeat-associated protein